MLERDLERLLITAQTQGLKQRILGGALRIGFKAVKALGFRDIPLDREERFEQVKSPRNAQIERLLALGFHAELGMTEEQYVASMPSLQPQPERFKGRFDLPVLVDPRVSLSKQLRMHGVRTDLTEAQLAQLSFAMLKSGNNIQEPYYIWVEEAVTYINFGFLSWDEEPINAIEALALLRERPNLFGVLHTFGFELANRLSEGRVATLELAGYRRPGPLGYTELNEDIKILSSDHFKNAKSPHLLNKFVLKGRV